MILLLIMMMVHRLHGIRFRRFMRNRMFRYICLRLVSIRNTQLLFQWKMELSFIYMQRKVFCLLAWKRLPVL